MLQNTFNVVFIVKAEKTNKKGIAPIFAKIKINGRKIELTTSRKIKAQLWSAETQQAQPVSKQKELNDYLLTFKGKLYTAYSQLLSTGERITPEQFKESFFGKPAVKVYSLIETTIEHNEQFEKNIGKKYSYGSFKNYKTTLKYLKEFIPAYYRKGDIPLLLVDYKFGEMFYDYLTSLKGCKENGANKQIQRIKKIVNYAIRLGYILTNPMATYSLTFKQPSRYPLSSEEIDLLRNVELSSETLQKVRDVFIFQCFTGLSYSDVKRLKHFHLLAGADGETWIKMERQKTKVPFSIPLLPHAVTVFNCYLNRAEHNECFFPVLSNQKMNDNLKVIQHIAGIGKNLTTHLARHTFATTITLSNGVPIETVSKMLGHTNLRTTQIYAKVVDTKISSDMKALKDQLR
ncbi:site-specific integrase [Segetibacter aerophilus]|uniref:Transposase n=1 Tax=Segetibacter aerophilus TaxID=670293 RepID=A0A512BFJ4_9BACT|nr:site-specific integrase [Segetibacter aerophilus]GEO10739.1 transposase [Segetibacter aerophilus]